MTEFWVNPLVEKDRLATYMVGDDQEIVFRKRLRVHNLDQSPSVIDVVVDRALLRSLVRTVQRDRSAVELAIASKKEAIRRMTEGLPIPDPDDDLFFAFRTRLWQIEPRLEVRSYSIAASEIALIVRELLLKELNERPTNEEWHADQSFRLRSTL